MQLTLRCYLKLLSISLILVEECEQIEKQRLQNYWQLRHQRAVSTSPESRIAGKRGFVEDKATIFLAKKFQHNMRKIGRSNIGKGPNTNLNRKHEEKCEKPMKYRFYNGTCNNLKHPLWGSSMIPFRRFVITNKVLQLFFID